MIADIGNSYYFGNWGASGLCYGLPDVRPKPSYVAVATMSLNLLADLLYKTVDPRVQLK